MNARYSIPLTVLLDALLIPYEVHPFWDDQARFDEIILYSPHHENFSDKGLVIGNMSEILAVHEKFPQIHFLCRNDCEALLPETEKNKRNIILLSPHLPLEEVHNKVICVWQRLQQWNTDMMISVLKGDPLQKLLDLSEPIIGNFIVIMDSAFRLLADTKHIAIDDEVSNRLLTNGYHESQTLKRFIELRRIEEFETRDDLVITTDHSMCEYDTIKRIFHKNGSICLYVVMHCNNHKVTPGLLDLFQQLLTYIYANYEKNSSRAFSTALAIEFITELLEGKISTLDDSIHQSAKINLPLRQNYCLFAVAFHDSTNIPFDSLVLLLSEQLVSSYVICYQRNILIICNIKDGQLLEDVKAKTFKVLEKQLDKNACTIGMSNAMDNLWQISTALEQANCAIEYGSHRVNTYPVSLYDFEESFLATIVSKSFCASEKMFENCFMVNAIRKISEYDRAHSTSMLETLETYLNCEKKATVVSKLLNMHRNTVLYQIERIQDILDISLKDQSICLKLQLGLLVRSAGLHKWLQP